MENGAYAAGNQIGRQWRLLQLLGRPTGLAVEDGACELQCAVRTVWRDLRTLQDVGFPIYDERDRHRGVWRVERGFQDRLPILLSLSEVVGLLMTRALELVDRMRAVVEVHALAAKLQQPAHDHVPAIQSALAERRSLWIRYYSMSRDGWM